MVSKNIQEELARLKDGLIDEKLEQAIWPLASRSGAIYAVPAKQNVVNAIPSVPVTSFAQAMQEHVERLQTEETKEN